VTVDPANPEHAKMAKIRDGVVRFFSEVGGMPLGALPDSFPPTPPW
jgi:hypothetical protein